MSLSGCDMLIFLVQSGSGISETTQSKPSIGANYVVPTCREGGEMTLQM